MQDDRHKTEPAEPPAGGFAEEANRPAVGLVREFWEFLRYNKKWWLTPIVLVLLLISALVVFSLATPAAAPFIYTLF